MKTWQSDLLLAYRALTKRVGYVFIAVSTIALGVGASTAIFSIVRDVLLTPIDLPMAGEVVSIWTDAEGTDYSPLSSADFKSIASEVESFEYVAARWVSRSPLLGDQEPEEVVVAAVTEDYFAVLGVDPVMGATLFRSEPGGVVIGDGLWRRRFGADPDILGATLQLGTDSYHIVGVLPRTPHPNVPNMSGIIEEPDVWRVLPESWLDWDWDLPFLRVTARLRDDVTVEQANTELGTFIRALNPSAGRGPDDFHAYAIGVKDHVVASVRPALYLLFGAALLLLLIACANVAQLTLARTVAQTRELAVRSALGGSRLRLTRVVVSESILLAAAGGVLGTMLAWLAIRGFVFLHAAKLPHIDAVRMPLEGLVFALAVTLVTLVLSGLPSALRATAAAPADALRQRTRAQSAASRRSSRVLVVTEVALTVVLIASSGLLLKTFVSLSSVDPGFATEHVMTMSVTPMRGRAGGRADRSGRGGFLRELEEAARQLPGIRAAGFANRMPLAGGVYTDKWATRATFGDEDLHTLADLRYVTPGYHEALGIDLISGRGFTASDGGNAMIVDEHLAREAFGAMDPVGQEIWTGIFGIEGWATIVGVVEHARHGSIVEDALPTIYYSAFAEPGASTWFTALRSTEETQADVVPLFKAALERIDPAATVSRVRSMEARMGEALAVQSVALNLMGFFAAVAAFLAAFGIYGLLSLTVNQRRRDYGIRMALGASRTRVTRGVLGEGTVLALIGIGFGLVGSLALTRLLGAILYDVDPLDPSVLAATSAAILAIALAGSFGPARRAVSVDPAIVLDD